MLDVVVVGPRPRDSVAHLRWIEGELGLSPSQEQSWQALEDVFEEITLALVAGRVIADFQTRSEAPTLSETLEFQRRQLALRMAATRRMINATSGVLSELSPRQRAAADRYLSKAWRHVFAMDV